MIMLEVELGGENAVTRAGYEAFVGIGILILAFVLIVMPVYEYFNPEQFVQQKAERAKREAAQDKEMAKDLATLARARKALQGFNGK